MNKILEELKIEGIKPARGIHKYIGLMFKKKPKPMIFVLGKEQNIPINSMFVKVDFLAIWLNKDDKIIDAKIIKPGEKDVRISKPFKTLIELPIYKE